MLPTSQADHPQYHSNMATLGKSCFLAMSFHETKEKLHVNSQMPPRFSCSFMPYSQRGRVWPFL